MRSGRWFLIRSHSRRLCFGGLGFLGLSVGGSFAALGLVGGFLRAALVFFGPVLTFLRRGKVCWNVILLGHCAGVLPGHLRRIHELGTIPAPAGEPKSWLPISQQHRVYPRACGGTVPQQPPCLCQYGLSPRLRGNRSRPIGRTYGPGSIPTRVGLAAVQTREDNVDKAHPRGAPGRTAPVGCRTRTRMGHPRAVARGVRPHGFRVGWLSGPSPAARGL